MSIYGYFAPKGPSGFGYGSTAEQVTEGVSLASKTMLVTGCNSGLGAEAVRVLALRGARVIGTARTQEKAELACRQFAGQALPLACELSEPASVRSSVEAVKREGLRLDAIICNAGIMALPKLCTSHGYEMQFFTNHIGHFMLVTGLLEQLSENGRVVVISSNAHLRAPKSGVDFANLDGSKGYDGWAAYGQSKFANLLFAKELARRFRGSKRTANAVHPGVIKTNLARNMNPMMSLLLTAFGPLALKNVAQGAATQVYAATSPALAEVSGEYLADCNLAKPRADAEDEQLARKLWTVSETIAAQVSSAAS